jgi:arylamine N-acetyltransferase
MPPYSVEGAASMFFDHFGLTPGAGSAAVEEIIGAFSTLPWENLTKFLRKAQADDGAHRLRGPATVIREHIELGTGGTCFSLTAALAEILHAAGLSCAPAMADMSHGKNIHCALLVRTPYGLLLADPGYLVPQPVLLDPSKPTVLDLQGLRMSWEPVDGGVAYDLHTEENGSRHWRYRLRTAPVSPAEFRRHWVSSFDAPGMNSLHLNRRVDGGRISAHNLNLRVVRPGGSANEKLADDFPGRISALFGVDRGLAEAAETEWRAACAARQALRS